jgi:hypothetical protein
MTIMTKQGINNNSSQKLISERKREANKLNAQKSIGPRTQEGKNISRWNAMKHGLLSKHAVITNYDDQKGFDHILSTMHSEFKPGSAIEEILVERIVDCYWNLGRIARFKQALITDQHNGWSNKESYLGRDFSPMGFAINYDTQDKSLIGFIIYNNTMQNLQRYETTIENRLYKALHELERLQRMRGGQLVNPPVVVDLQQ